MELEEGKAEQISESCACLLSEAVRLRGGCEGWQSGSSHSPPGHGPIAFLQSPPTLRKSQAKSSTLLKWVGPELQRGKGMKLIEGLQVFDAANLRLIPTPDQQAIPAE